MPKFAANLSMLFTEVPFLDRFERAAKAGFQAVEFLFPYAHPAADIKARLDAHGLKLVLHNLPAGDWDAGERGIACLPDRIDEFRDGVTQAIEYARRVSEQWGVPYRVLDASAVRASEPAVVGAVAGAIHWTGPWSVSDPGRLVKAYAELFVRRGGSIMTGDANSLTRVGRAWRVTTAAGEADVTHSVAETVSVLADPSPPPRIALPEQLVLGRDRYGR